MNILYINIHGVRNMTSKINNVLDLATKNSVSIIVMNESRRRGAAGDVVSLPNYTSLYNSRKNKHYGTAIFVRNDVDFTILTVDNNHYNTILIELENKFKILTAYRSPTENQNNFINFLDRLYSNLEDGNVLFVGNTNIDLLCNNRLSTYLRMLKKHNLEIKNKISKNITCATAIEKRYFKITNDRGESHFKKNRTKKIIDHIISRKNSFSKIMWVHNHFSEHKYLLLTIRAASTKEKLAFQKCIAPSNKRSLCWQYFGYPGDHNDEILTESKIVCQLCHHVLNNLKTTNMKGHLEKKHNLTVLTKERPNFQCFQNDKTMDQFRLISANGKYSLSVYKWKSFDQLDILSVSMNSVAWTSIPTAKFKIHTINMREDEVELSFLNLSNCVAITINSFDPAFERQVKSYFCGQTVIPTTRCLLSTIEMAVWECFKLPEVKEVVEPAFCMLRRLGLSLADMNSTFWVSKWSMLDSFCDMSNQASEFRSDDKLQVILSSVKEIVEIIRPLKLAVETLVKGNPSAGLAKPYVTQLLKTLLNVRILNYELDDCVESIGETLHSIIKSYLEDYLKQNTFLVVAQYFDPRFQSACTQDELRLVHSVIDAFFSINREGNDSFSSPDEINEIDSEVFQYQREPPLPVEGCPLEWWSTHECSYPNLKMVADSYICVPTINIAAYTRTKLGRAETGNR